MPSGERAIAPGLVPTVTVAATVFVDVLITDTFPEPLLVTYARVPSGERATASGSAPTVTVAATVFVDVLITDTFPEP